MGPLMAVDSTRALDPAALVLIALAAGWYARSVRAARRRGASWPAGRSLAAAAAGVAALAATNGWVAANDVSRFSAHAVQHVLLALVVPLCVVLAAPLTLALRTSSPSTRQALHRWSSAPWLRLAAHPLVAGTVFSATVVVMYATPLFAWSLTSAPVHVLVHTHLVVIGLLLFWPLLGADPAPVRIPHPARVGLLVLILPLHALLAMMLMAADPPVGGATAIRLAAAAGVDPVVEQRLGAGVLWMAGDLVALAAVAVACYRWWRADTAFTRVGAGAPAVGSRP